MDYIKDLLDKQLINKLSLLLLYYKDIGLSEEEVIIIMIIEQYTQTNTLITSKIIEENTNLSKPKVEYILNNLLNKQFLSFESHAHSINISNTYQKINNIITGDIVKNNINNINKEDNSIIKIFEKEFNRKLTPLEVETIREWLETFNNELIIYALKQSVLSGVLNLRYIERIIIEQSKIING